MIGTAYHIKASAHLYKPPFFYVAIFKIFLSLLSQILIVVNREIKCLAQCHQRV